MSTKTDLAALGWRVDTAARLTQAIKDFQRGWNLGAELTVDGSDGPKTRGAIAVSMVRLAAKQPTASPHFSFTEVRCDCHVFNGGTPQPDCRRIWADRELFRALEAFRTLSGPLNIDRGCRCPTENARVNGASRSQHLFGRAADITLFDISPAKVKALRIVRGMGLYDWQGRQVVRHIDVRPENSWLSPATWDYGNAKAAPLAPRPVSDDPAPAPAPVAPQEEDDMYTDADRARDEYQVKQNKAIAQLVVDYALKTDTRIQSLEAAVGILANSQGVNPDLIAKLIAEKIGAIKVDVVVTNPEEIL